jgi:hypothetical protein
VTQGRLLVDTHFEEIQNDQTGFAEGKHHVFSPSSQFGAMLSFTEVSDER